MFKFDEKNKDTFKHLQFELQNNDSKELKMIQFYALCRYQLSAKIPCILSELRKLYGQSAPTVVNLHSWVINNCRKSVSIVANSTPETPNLIDLTKDDIEDQTLNITPATNNNGNDTKQEINIQEETIMSPLASISFTETEYNETRLRQDTNIRYYFCCRNKLNQKYSAIHFEMKRLFENSLLPKSLGTLYHWAKRFNSEKKIDELFKYSTRHKSGFENLKFRLTVKEPIETKRIQFYALCRKQLDEPVSKILIELKRLYRNEAPSFAVLNTWISKLWNKKESDMSDFEESMEHTSSMFHLDENDEENSIVTVVSDIPDETNNKNNDNKGAEYEKYVSNYIEQLQKFELMFTNKKNSFNQSLNSKNNEIERLKLDMSNASEQYIIDLNNKTELISELETCLAKEKEINLEYKSNETIAVSKLNDALEKIKSLEASLKEKNEQYDKLTGQFTESQTDLIKNLENSAQELKDLHSKEIEHLKSGSITATEYYEKLIQQKFHNQIKQLELFNRKLKEINMLNEENLIEEANKVKKLKNDLDSKNKQIEQMKEYESVLKEELVKLDNESSKRIEHFEKLNTNLLSKTADLTTQLNDEILKYQNELKTLKDDSLKEIMEYVNELNNNEKTIRVYKIQLEEKEAICQKLHNDFNAVRLEKESDIQKITDKFKHDEKHIHKAFKKMKALFHTKVDELRVENENLKEIKTKNEERIRSQSYELNDLKRQYESNHPESFEKPNRMQEIKLAEANIQTQISEKNFRNLKREFDALLNENLNLKADLTNASETIDRQGFEIINLKQQQNQQQQQHQKHVYQLERPNNNDFKVNIQYKKQLSELKGTITNLNNQLGESYEFLIEKDTIINRMDSDLNNFKTFSDNVYEQYVNKDLNEFCKLEPNFENDCLKASVDQVIGCIQTLVNKLKKHENKQKFTVITLQNEYKETATSFANYKENKNDSIEAFRNLTGFKTNNFNNFDENELQILQ